MTDADTLADRLAHMTEARDNARAEVERLAAKLDAVREWIDRRGVNVDDHAEQLERYRRANWAGLAIYHHVLDLHRKGRKSAWVHDLMQIHDTEMSKR